MADQDLPEGEPVRKRRLLYGEPDNSFMDVPRSTYWRKNADCAPANNPPQVAVINEPVADFSSGNSTDHCVESEHESDDEPRSNPKPQRQSKENRSTLSSDKEQGSDKVSSDNSERAEEESDQDVDSDNSITEATAELENQTACINPPENDNLRRSSTGARKESEVRFREGQRRGRLHQSNHLHPNTSSNKSQLAGTSRTDGESSCSTEYTRERPDHEELARCQSAHEPGSSPHRSTEDLEEQISEESQDEDDQHPSDDLHEDLHWSQLDTDASEGDEEDPQPLPLPQEGCRPPPPPNQQPVPPIPTHAYLKAKLQGPFSEKIQDFVAASRGEILLNVQEYFKQHPGPLTAQEDLHRLINSIFYKEIIPDSTFKLDKLYASTNNIRYFFYCSKCNESFGELNYKLERNYKCQMCDTVNMIHDLTKASFFILIDVLPQLQLVLEDPAVASKLRDPNYFQGNTDTLKDLYNADMYQEFVASLDFTQNHFFLSFTGCTDGTPLFESSSMSIWPIFLMVNELPPYIRMSNILLSGLWFGRQHPKMDLFLEPFADYIRNLSCRGFNLNVCGEVRHYKAYLIAFCADSGARGPVQCVHCHNGAYPCNWCLHPGEAEGGGSSARKFPQLEDEPLKRTSGQMIRDGKAVLDLPGDGNHINGVTGISPLLRCPKFDIIRGMVLDNLHWASFGIARRMGQLWLGENKNKKKDKNQENNQMPPYYVGTDETKSLLNNRIIRIRPPVEVRRLPRDLSQLHDYSARDWENFTLYFSVPIFKNILPERFLRHWTQFVQAFYILMKDNLKRTEIRVAGEFMKSYVDGVEDLYGVKEMTFNMHISNHAEDNARRWGNGSSISAYAFENGNRILKSKINAERGIPHQVIRSLERDLSLSILRNMATTPQATECRARIRRKEVKQSFFAGSVRCIMPRDFNPTAEELWLCQHQNVDAAQFSQCNRIIVENVCYGVDTGARTDNSFALCGEHIFKIRKIIADELSGNVFLFVSRVRCSPYPVPRCTASRNFSVFMYTVDLIEQGMTIVPSESLVTVCVHTAIDCTFYKGEFVSIMPNTANVF